MIRDYANLAANERACLARVRAVMEIVAPGFVIRDLNAFLPTLARTVGFAPHERLERPTGPPGC